jgi:uncharacterized protein (TIGR04551 family)
MSRPLRRAAPCLAAWAIGVSFSPLARAQAESPEEDGPSPAAVGAALEGEPAPTSTATAPIDAERLRREIREELKESLREEIKAELREELLGEIEDAQGAPLEPAVEPLEDDDWAEEGWKWEQPMRPELNLLELDGYFRFRYDWFAELDLGTYYNRGARTEDGFEELAQGPFVPGFAPPTPLCNTDVRFRGSGQPGDATFEGADSCFNREGDSNILAGANVRFRLEPTLNVYEDIQIHAQIDILDNLVLGSTPDSDLSVLSPLAVLSQSQVAPTVGQNVLWRDSIRVKRVWAEVMTPLGQLSFGRMPNHVGMGTTANDGNGLDQDFGDTVDRIQFATEIGDFMIAPAFDFTASGATSANTNLPRGQPFDRDEADDVYTYVLTAAKQDSPEVIARKLANDDTTLDFGTQLSFRNQNLDVPFEASGGPEGQATTRQVIKRDAEIGRWIFWAELRWRDLTVSAEYSGLYGTIGDVSTSAGDDARRLFGSTEPRRVELNQHGGALRGTYKLLNDALTIELLLLGASGDGAPGFGVFPLYEWPEGTGYGPGAWDGTQARNGQITNFRFDPDFIVDLIFWRQLVGLVTDAFVVRPSVQYDLTNQLGGRLDVIYSRSWFGTSTPSGSFVDSTLGGPDENLGVEADVTLFYRSEQGFNAQLQYGVFFPMDGLDRLAEVEEGRGEALVGTTPVLRLDAQIAHTLQVLLGVTF